MVTFCRCDSLYNDNLPFQPPVHQESAVVISCRCLTADSGVGFSQDATALSSSHTSAPQSNVGGDASYVANGIMLETDRSPSPFSQRSKAADHSRHVSWDDTHPEAATTGGFQDSGEPFVNSCSSMS